MIEQLQQLKTERSKYAGSAELYRALKNDLALQRAVRELTKYFLKREVRGCSNCLFDAYMELIHFNLDNKEIFKKIMTQENCKFSIKKGILISDGNSANLLSNANITDKLALFHLKRNPKLIGKFDRYPENWEELTGIKKPAKSKKEEKPAATDQTNLLPNEE